MSSSSVMQEALVRLLAAYQSLVVRQLDNLPLVGEYLTVDQLNDARLLCQMRTILFLVKTAPWLAGDNIERASELYFKAESQYRLDGVWRQKLHSDETASLYSHAFVLLAQSYLYKATKDPWFAVELAETYTYVEAYCLDKNLFKPLSDGDFLEQNSAMHLYEALSYACYQAQAVYMKPVVLKLEQCIKQMFWQVDKQVLAEKVTKDGDVISYEAGHWFEWYSLLWRAKQWRGETLLAGERLYQSAMDYAPFTSEGMLLNEMNNIFVPLDTKKVRIWPSLEFLRAKALKEQQLPISLIEPFITLFFDERGLPLEYLPSEDVQEVKSTTGYHIAESFVDMLTVLR